MEQLNTILSSAKKVFITSHLKPDPDALGSLLGVYDYVVKKYPQVTIDAYLTGEADLTFTYLKSFNKIKWVEDVADFVSDYDTLIFVDASTISRFTDFAEKIELGKYQSICIDHHKNPPDSFTLNLSDSNKPAASQLVYELLFRNNKDLLDPGVAEVLLTGIMGDTGRGVPYMTAKKRGLCYPILLI